MVKMKTEYDISRRYSYKHYDSYVRIMLLGEMNPEPSLSSQTLLTALDQSNKQVTPSHCKLQY